MLYKKINNIEGWINSWTKDNDWINYPLIFNFKPLKTNLKKCLNTKNPISGNVIDIQLFKNSSSIFSIF